MAAMPSPRPVKPRPSAALAVTWTEPGTVAHDGRGHVGDRPAGLAGQRRGLAAEAEAVGAGPAWVAGREVLAEVAEAGGAQHRVADGVGEHVGVGVAGEAALERHHHPAEDQRSPIDQGVQVDPLPDAHAWHECGRGPRRPRRLAAHGGAPVVRRRATMASATARSRAVVILRFSTGPGTTRTAWPDPSTRAASSVASTPSRAARRCASSRTARSKSWGVWMARSCSRSR